MHFINISVVVYFNFYNNVQSSHIKYYQVRSFLIVNFSCKVLLKMASSDPRLENDQQSPIKIGPKVKRPRISTDTENSCIIWLKSDKLKLTKAGEKGINTLKAASQVRKDDHMQLHGDIYYHKTCYTSYCSQQNLKYVNPTTEGASDHSTCTTR